MRTRVGRWTLAIVFLATIGFTIWVWTRPYEWKPDPAARALVKDVEVERDHAFRWVTVHVESTSIDGLDLTQPVYLRLSGTKKLSPADTRLSGSRETGFDEAWYRFWLEEQDSFGPLKLEIHDGLLLVKSSEGAPDLKHGDSRTFTTHHW